MTKLLSVVLRTLCVLFVMTAVPAHANTVVTSRTESTLLADVKSIRPGKDFWALVRVKMQSGWHTYWINPGDSGTTASFDWTLPGGFKTGEAQFLPPDRLSVGPLVDYGYSDNAYYPIRITPPSILGENTTSILAVKARWLVCKDICVPETANLSIALPAKAAAEPDASPDAALIADKVAHVPEQLSQPFRFYEEDGKIHFDMKIKEGPAVKTAQFFPAEDGFITNAADPVVSVDPGRVSFTLQKGDGKVPPTTWGMVSLFLQDGSRKDFIIHLQGGPKMAAGTAGSVGTILGSILFALLGGLILNLMPCVFPVLSLKALAVAKKAQAHPATVRLQGIAYTAGVVLSFLLLASILIGAQKAGGEALGWGFQMQSPIFVTILALLLFTVGLNLSGLFELPVLFGSVKGATDDNLYGSFLTGAFAVLVATPCTAPFMASAVGFALSQPIPVVLAVFSALGLGLAAPFLAITFCPPLIAKLPKPGAWMLSFKQVLAFPMYLSAVWLVWVLSREATPDAGAAALLAMVLVVFSLWLWQRGAGKSALAIFIVGLAACLSILQMAPAAGRMLHSHAEPFSMSRLEALRSEGKPVFVDATADWCITCKVNETVALSSHHIMQTFADKNIVYMVADWTKGDAEITQYLQSFGRGGVPLYVYYPPKDAPSVVLPQLLTESIVLKVIQ